MATKKDKKANPNADPATPAARISADWKAIAEKLSYKGIVGNLPFMVFIAVLCMVYIANTHHAVETQRELNKANDYIKELHWHYTDAQTRLMNAGTETEIIRNGTKVGLKPLTLPAYSLTDTAKSM